jgi:CTP synthase
VVDKGGTMRLGAWPCSLKKASRAHRIYSQDDISERHRHRYEVNIAYEAQLAGAGMVFSGKSPDGVLPEIIEIPVHPWFIGVQFHPELKSRPFDPHPLFTDFIRAAVDQSRLV